MTAEPNARVHDVICHMDIGIQEAAGRSDYEGRSYYFCAIGCKTDFDADPGAAIKAEEEYDHTQPMDHGMATARAASGQRPWWQFWRR